MGLRDIRIGTRLGMGFGSILLILAAMVAMINFLNFENKKILTRGLDLSNAKSLQAATMKSSMLETGIAMRNIGLLSDVALMQKEKDNVKNQRSRSQAALKTLQELGLDGIETKMLSDVAALDRDVAIAFKEAVGKALAFELEGAAKVIFEKIDPLNRQALISINKLVDLQQQKAHQLLERSVEADSKLLILMFVLGTGAVALGAMCGLFITRSITRPLHDAVDVARKVAEGKLTSRVEDAGQDETGTLLRSLKEMNENLASTISEVRSGTETISIAAREISAGNADLSMRTESQASSLEETASSMEELTSTVRQNADNARHANQLSASAQAVAEKGGDVVSQVISKMGSIKERSRQVVDIISVIDSIAFQTNILALNAAVEAARAGEQGRGFAVVATEVRNLAQRSAAAAKGIKDLIGASVAEVEDGSKLVDEAGSTMDQIVVSIRQVADIMAEITAATEEQSIGIEEVNKAVSIMDEMTQQNAALVEQAAAAAESMDGQAKRLSAAVSVFKLIGDDRGSPPGTTSNLYLMNSRAKPVQQRRRAVAFESKKLTLARSD